MKKVLIITISTLIFFGLNSFTTSNNPFKDLMGIWHLAVYEHGLAAEYIRGRALEQYDDFAWGGGLKFMENGEIIVRQNAGLCGTPPISYANFVGTWESLSDSTLRINYPSNVLGRRVVEWQIVELSSDKLKVKVLLDRMIRSSGTTKFKM